MLLPPIITSEIWKCFLPQQQPMFCSSQFCGCSQSRIIQKTKEKKIEIWLYYNGGPNSFFFFVMNFCTAIFTHEKEYFISNAWIYYQRVVSKKIEGNFGFGRNVVSFWLPS
jgi:hypothetical protein